MDEIPGAPPIYQAISPIRLTWQGHEFVESVKNETLWKKAKEKLGSESVGATFEVLKALLTSMVKSQVGLE